MPLYPASERDALYRMLYRADPQNKPEAPAAAVRDAILRGIAHLNHYAIALQQAHKITLTIPPPESLQRAQLHARFGDSRPQGIGIKQSEYASLSPAEATDATRFIATDYLLDCNALVMVARDARGHVLRTALAHTNITNDADRAIGQLLAGVPAGARVEMSLISSADNSNPYRQIDLLEKLTHHPGISSVRYYPQRASTVAVEVATGKLFTAAPHETQASAYAISELPLRITFSAYGDDQRHISQLGYAYFVGHGQSSLPLSNAYDAAQQRFTNDGLVQPEIERILKDNQVSAEELQALANTIGRLMAHPVTIAHEPDPSGYQKFSIKTVEGDALTQFFSSPAAGLGSKGTFVSR